LSIVIRPEMDDRLDLNGAELLDALRKARARAREIKMLLRLSVLLRPLWPEQTVETSRGWPSEAEPTGRVLVGPLLSG